MSSLLHYNIPKLPTQFVPLSLQIAKLCQNQLKQIKMVLIVKILPLKREEFHVLEYIFDFGKYQIRPTAH